MFIASSIQMQKTKIIMKSKHDLWEKEEQIYEIKRKQDENLGQSQYIAKFNMRNNFIAI